MTDDAILSWEDIIGPVYSSEAFREFMGMTSEELQRSTEDLEVLGINLLVVYYPEFQLDGNSVISGLPDVLRTLQTGIDDPLTWVLWLRIDVPETGRNIDRLRSGDFDAVLEEARHDAEAWRQ